MGATERNEKRLFTCETLIKIVDDAAIGSENVQSRHFAHSR